MVKAGKCWQGQPHLPGIIRPDGSQHCARCGQQLQPPDKRRAWRILAHEKRRPDSDTTSVGTADGLSGGRICPVATATTGGAYAAEYMPRIAGPTPCGLGEGFAVWPGTSGGAASP